jgi:hypothetical protein
MRDFPLTNELAAKWGNLPGLAYRGNDEWSGACPKCSDWGHIGSDPPDRFRLFAATPTGNARGWCRRCGHFEWVDEGDDYGSPSPDAIAAAEAERTRLARMEIDRQQAKIKAIEDAAYWKGWHDQMTDDQRRMWHQQGVIDFFVDYYSLGYTTHHTYFHGGQECQSPAMTIPHYGDEWHLTNIQYRLTQPAPGAGKYRQTSKLPAAMFRTEPEQPLSGPVLMVEGAKKAIVCYTHLGSEPLGTPLAIVGIPSKAPSTAMLDELRDADPVYIGLDPDAYDGSAQRVGDKLGRERVRYVHFPAKPDDLIVEYKLDGDALKKYLRGATRSA